MAARRKPRTRPELVGDLAKTSRVCKEQVAAVLEAMSAEIKLALSTQGVITVPGLVKIQKKTVSACPTWPAYVEVTLAREMLLGPDAYCEQGLHTYFRSPATNERGHPVCGSCGGDDIGWERLHERDITDIEYAVAQLKTDRWQYGWWCKPFDPEAVQHAHRKGPGGIKDAVRQRVTQSVARVYPMKNGKRQPFRDGAQTPFHGNIIYYGQHATATCCRKCIEVWHGIPRGRALTQEETDYLVEVLMAFIAFRGPELGDA